MTGKISVYTPHAPPLPPTDGERPTEKLSATQEEMFEAVLGHFAREDYKLPDETEPELREIEKLWLTRECLLRYLRAVKWASAKEAIQRLEGTLKWRREFGLLDLTADTVEPESLTGKMILYGYDVARRPALYLLPSRQNTTEPAGQIQFTVWMLERTLDLAGPGVETLSLMINYGDKGKNPSFSTAKTVLNILQTHYPERLGHALILNVPWVLNAFFKLISPFIDPITRTKMKFNPRPVDDGLFAADQLLAESGWGGAVDLAWDHKKYWPAFVRLCAETRERQLQRWRAIGARVGLSEWDIKLEREASDAPVAAHTVPEAAVAGSAEAAEVQSVAQAVAPAVPEAAGLS